jgi:hypothetical protein
VPEPPLQPPFEPRYSAKFEAHRVRLGLTGEAFDYFWRAVEKQLSDYPYHRYSREVPDHEGIRIFPTEEAYPDLPALYVYYRVEHQPNRIHYLALSPAWSRSDLV